MRTRGVSYLWQHRTATVLDAPSFLRHHRQPKRAKMVFTVRLEATIGADLTSTAGSQRATSCWLQTQLNIIQAKATLKCCNLARMMPIHHCVADS